MRKRPANVREGLRHRRTASRTSAGLWCDALDARECPPRRGEPFLHFADIRDVLRSRFSARFTVREAEEAKDRSTHSSAPVDETIGWRRVAVAPNDRRRRELCYGRGLHSGERPQGRGVDEALLGRAGRESRTLSNDAGGRRRDQCAESAPRPPRAEDGQKDVFIYRG